MILLLLFAFLAGIVTILSPCILPILPIVLSGSVGGGKRRPLGIVAGFILSFTFFTLFLTAAVRATGISPDILRWISIIVIFSFGLSLIIPKFQIFMEQLFTNIASISPNQVGKSGFIGGVVIGLSLGLLWTPCVGPILASVISLALTGAVTKTAVFITIAYSIGTAIPMLAITYGGRALLTKVPWLLSNTAKIQKLFGIIMMLTAVALFFNIDRTFQTFILDKFPQYGVGLTKFEDTARVREQLNSLQNRPIKEENIGKPMNTVLQDSLGRAPEFIAGGEWINSKPLTMESLRGKVVLVDFWTYTCINCIRTLPYIKTWWEKYKDKGLVIVGVHTPEFEFEKNADNVKKAVRDFSITYPVMQDNDYATWTAYANHYWPAKYLVDKTGKIRYTHFGEGNYNETEKMIQDLLTEAGAQVSSDTINNPLYQVSAKTPETYLGNDRMSGLVSPEQVTTDKEMIFTYPVNLSYNQFAFSGTWVITGEVAMPKKGAKLAYNFDAGEVFLVMRPKTEGISGKVKVTLDKKDPGIEAGEDVRNGIVTVDSDRLYKLIKLKSPGNHILELEFLDNNLELYAFTFG